MVFMLIMLTYETPCNVMIIFLQSFSSDCYDYNCPLCAEERVFSFSDTIYYLLRDYYGRCQEDQKTIDRRTQ